jgi:predicted alpha/beta hydrolase
MCASKELDGAAQDVLCACGLLQPHALKRATDELSHPGGQCICLVGLVAPAMRIARCLASLGSDAIGFRVELGRRLGLRVFPLLGAGLQFLLVVGPIVHKHLVAVALATVPVRHEPLIDMPLGARAAGEKSLDPLLLRV